MYGEIIDPEYYVEIWPRQGLQTEYGPFETESKAENRLLSLLPNIRSTDFWYVDDVLGLEKLGDRRWFVEEENAEYAIVEREKD